VIDCPRLTHTKNAADIRLVVDAVDALSAEPAYDEFVIASGDSDMTPLLVRLRAGDRRTTIVSPSDAADAFTAVADRLVDGQQVLELVQGEQIDPDDEAEVANFTELPGIPFRNVPMSGDERPDRDEAFERFRTIVTERYVAASGPLNLASLAYELRRELGRSIDDSRWFGFGGFARSLESLELPNMRLSQHLLWDGSRHETPDLTASAAHGLSLPEPVTRLTALLSLPRLQHESWSPIYRVLSDYVNSHQFNLTEATRWSRDRLVEQGVDVSRNAVGFVTRGAAFGGCPLYRKPPPTAVEIGAAFVENVLSRAEAAAIAITAEETEVIRAWLAEPQSDPEEQ
jgi:NYN domain